MTNTRRRRSYEEGHRRKMLVIVDESAEVEAALYFCAGRVERGSAGAVVLLYVIQPEDFQSFAGVRQIHVEEETNKAKALFRLFRRKLNAAGYEHVAIEEVVREGKPAEAIAKLIDEDDDIAILVLGAAVDNKGPGPLVSSLAAGKLAGTFPIPITIVPGFLTLEELKALA